MSCERPILVVERVLSKARNCITSILHFEGSGCLGIQGGGRARSSAAGGKGSIDWWNASAKRYRSIGSRKVGIGKVEREVAEVREAR